MRRRPLQTAMLIHALAVACLAAPPAGVPEYVVVLSWGGQEEARWTGRLRVEGGRLGETVPWMKPYGRIRREGSPFAFDDEDDAFEATRGEVSWDTRTRPGVPDGLVLHLSGDEATRLHVSATRSDGVKGETVLALAELSGGGGPAASACRERRGPRGGTVLRQGR